MFMVETLSSMRFLCYKSYERSAAVNQVMDIPEYDDGILTQPV